MTDQDAVDFKRLFEQAMAAAPPPVELDEINARRALTGDDADAAPDDASPPTLDIVADETGAELRPVRWLAVASAALAAAVLIAVMVLPSRQDQTLQTSEVAPSTAPGLSTPASVAASPTTDVAPPTNVVITAQLEADAGFAVPLDDPPTLVLANGAGVERRTPDGVVAVFDSPALVAHATSDGRVFAALANGEIVQWDPDSDTVESLDLPGEAGGPPVLHDVADVAGVVTLLYELPPVTCEADADLCDVTLHTFEPDTGETTQLVTLAGALFQWVSIGLSDNGIVIGEISSADGTSFYSGLSGLDIAEDVPQPDALGLETSPLGCDVCPRSFTIDSPGRHIAWVQGSDLVVVDLDEPSRRAIARSVVPDLGPGGVSIDVTGIEIDGELIVSGVATVSRTDAQASVVVDLASGASSLFEGRLTLR